MANRSIGTWVAGAERLVCPQPAFKDATEKKKVEKNVLLCVLLLPLAFHLFKMAVNASE